MKSGTRKEAEKMPRSRPWLVALSVMAFLFSLAAGPLLGDARAQEQVELRIWDQFTEGSESPTVEAIYAAFMEQNPNITITREAISSDQMRQTVNTAIASGTGPDIILYDAGPATPVCWPTPVSCCHLTTMRRSTAGKSESRRQPSRPRQSTARCMGCRSRPISIGMYLQQDAARSRRNDRTRDVRRSCCLLR